MAIPSFRGTPSSRTNSFEVSDLLAREQAHRVHSLLAIVGLTAFALLLIALLGTTGVLLGLVFMGGAVAVAGLTVWLWRSPVRGVFVLFAAAVAVDVDYTPTTANGYYIAHYLPFWQDFTAWTHIHIIVSPAELFMGLLLFVWLFKSTATRNFSFDKGSLMLPVGLYMAMVLIGELHGIATGGNITTSLWELRGQIYMLVAYVLACNLVKSRSSVTTLIWILLFGAGFRAIEGTIRYFIYYRGHVLQVIDVFPHDQAFFFNAFITFTAILFLYKGPRKMMRVALCLLPFVLFIDLAIDRRAAVAALGAGLLLLLMVTAVVNPARRRLSVSILVLLALAFPPYYLKYQNSYGTIAEPARAIASKFHPDPRDASSNQYRVDESFDIMSTMKSSTVNSIIGYGYGKPMLTPRVLANISVYYVFWNIMPHNSILWVWMRIGTIGYLLLWLMIGSAVLQAMRVARRVDDLWMRGMAVFIALMVVQEIVFGFYDLQWTDYRNLVAIGIFFALISRLTLFARNERVFVGETVERPRPGERLDFQAASSLAVVNGRLIRRGTRGGRNGDAG